MQKMLCPFCDHEIQGKGKCEFCGSWVKKPVYAETTADFGAKASAEPNECDCSLHSPQLHEHDDTYRDSEDASFQNDYCEAYGEAVPGAAAAGKQTAAGAAAAGTGAGAVRRRAVLASEAVAAQRAGAPKGKTGSSGSKVAKVIIVIIIINFALQILLTLLD